MNIENKLSHSLDELIKQDAIARKNIKKSSTRAGTNIKKNRGKKNATGERRMVGKTQKHRNEFELMSPETKVLQKHLFQPKEKKELMNNARDLLHTSDPTESFQFSSRPRDVSNNNAFYFMEGKGTKWKGFKPLRLRSAMTASFKKSLKSQRDNMYAPRLFQTPFNAAKRASLARAKSDNHLMIVGPTKPNRWAALKRQKPLAAKNASFHRSPTASLSMSSSSLISPPMSDEDTSQIRIVTQLNHIPNPLAAQLNSRDGRLLHHLKVTGNAGATEPRASAMTLSQRFS